MSNFSKVSPDGGYGWIVVFSQALSNIVIVSLMQTFGLIFKDTFINLGMSATEGSFIINLNLAAGMLTGLINGALLKIYGYRKIAILGAALLTSGIILTSFATTFQQFLICYGIIASLGMGMSLSAYTLALNTYFKKKKDKAVSLSMTVTGLGPILMPQLVNLLMKYHTVQGVTLIIGGVTAHIFIAALLLQPVKWHLKNELIDNEIIESKKIEEIDSSSLLSIDHDQEASVIYGVESALGGSLLSLHGIGTHKELSLELPVLTENNVDIDPKINSPSVERIYNYKLSQPIKRASLWNRIYRHIFKLIDLDLMKDPIYINIMIGMSLAMFAEMNFSVLTAFILADFGLKTGQIATFLSLLAIADIIFRFLAPYIGRLLGKPARPMYAITLMLLIITRFSLLLSNDYNLLLVVAIGLGIAKGVRTVYMSLVIPTYVPLEKLASASGMQMMINGFCVLVGGIILGIVRDKTGSYTACIFIMNSVTLTTIIMWSIEGCIIKYLKNIKSHDCNRNQEDVPLKK